jgi:hypothetical protein
VAAQPDHLPRLEEVLLVCRRVVGRIGHARARLHLLQPAPVIAGGNRRASARDHGYARFEQAIRSAGNDLAALHGGEGVLDVVQRIARDVSRDRGTPASSPPATCPTGSCPRGIPPRRSPAPDPGNRGIEYLRQAAGANRFSGGVRGTGLLRGSRTPRAAARRHQQSAHHQPRDDDADTAHARSVPPRRSPPAMDTGPGLEPVDANTHSTPRSVNSALQSDDSQVMT